MNLYFVQTKSHGLIQVESTLEYCSPIKYCMPVNYELAFDYVKIINASQETDLIYICSQLYYNVKSSDTDCQKR